MKKTMKILLISAASAVGAGLVIVTVAAACVGFDMTRLSTISPYVYTDYESAKAFTSIAIRDTSAAVTIETSPDDKVHVHYGTNNHEKYVFNDAGTGLSLTVDSSYSWFDVFSWARPQKTLTLSLPSLYEAQTDVSVANGSITLTDVTMTGTMRLANQNGPIAVTNLVADSLTVSDQNGSESVKNTTLLGKFKCTNANGSIDVDGLAASFAEIETQNGHEDVKNITSVTDLSITNSNGWIGLSAVDVSRSVTLTVANGSINGNLKGPMSDYTITSHTGNGSSNLPSYLAATTGNKTLQAHAGNGSINLTFVV